MSSHYGRRSTRTNYTLRDNSATQENPGSISFEPDATPINLNEYSRGAFLKENQGSNRKSSRNASKRKETQASRLNYSMKQAYYDTPQKIDIDTREERRNIEIKGSSMASGTSSAYLNAMKALQNRVKELEEELAKEKSKSESLQRRLEKAERNEISFSEEQLAKTKGKARSSFKTPLNFENKLEEVLVEIDHLKADQAKKNQEIVRLKEDLVGKERKIEECMKVVKESTLNARKGESERISRENEAKAKRERESVQEKRSQRISKAFQEFEEDKKRVNTREATMGEEGFSSGKKEEEKRNRRSCGSKYRENEPMQLIVSSEENRKSFGLRKTEGLFGDSAQQKKNTNWEKSQEIQEWEREKRGSLRRSKETELAQEIQIKIEGDGDGRKYSAKKRETEDKKAISSVITSIERNRSNRRQRATEMLNGKRNSVSSFENEQRMSNLERSANRGVTHEKIVQENLKQLLSGRASVTNNGFGQDEPSVSPAKRRNQSQRHPRS